MYSRSNPVGLLLAGVLLSASLAAQQGEQSPGMEAAGKTASPAARYAHESTAQSSLLNVSEGLSVIGSALEASGRSRLDCSHLVHTIYERAGFPYSYASSSDLFAGIDDFQRVTRPHAGDLVVWPGHVGIVVNPSGTTFFSALRTGAGVESYSSTYWKGRGIPRFYRYAKVAAAERTKTTETASLTRTALDADAEAGGTKLSADSNPANFNSVRVQVIESAKLQVREVTQVLLHSLSIDPEGLRDADPFRLARPLIVFSQLEVKAIKIHGHQGQIQVRITELLSLDGGQVNLKEWQQIQTWPLRWRDRKSWELQLPQDAIYIPRETAVRLFAHQLSRLAENPSVNTRQESELAQMLNIILKD
jgi:hypothetical protein